MPSKKDLPLLFELDRNYRNPYSKIARKIRMSQQLVNYKVKAMVENGSIMGNYPLIDYSRLGYLNFHVYFKVNYVSRERFAELVGDLKKHESIISIMEADGRHDLMTVFAAKNPSAFNKMLREVISSNPKQLKKCMVLTSVVEHHFPKNYLVNRMKINDVVTGGDREQAEIDDTDKKIMKALVENRKNVVEISQASGVSPQTVISHLKQLEKKEVIKGYRMILDMKKLGFIENKILIKFHTISVDRENQLSDFCKAHQNITEFVKTFGEWDMEITVETKTKEEFRNIFIALREKFSDVIADFDNFTVVRTYKKQMMPEEFLSS